MIWPTKFCFQAGRGCAHALAVTIPLLKSICRSLLLFRTHWSQSETILLRSFQDMGEVCTTTQCIYFDTLKLPRLLAAQTEFEHVRMNCPTNLLKPHSRFSCAPRVFLLVMAVMVLKKLFPGFIRFPSHTPSCPRCLPRLLCCKLLVQVFGGCSRSACLQIFFSIHMLICFKFFALNNPGNPCKTKSFSKCIDLETDRHS